VPTLRTKSGQAFSFLGFFLLLLDFFRIFDIQGILDKRPKPIEAAMGLLFGAVGLLLC